MHMSKRCVQAVFDVRCGLNFIRVLHIYMPWRHQYGSGSPADLGFASYGH